MPVLYVDLDPEEEALVLATLDPIGAMAGRDDEKLQALLADVTRRRRRAARAPRRPRRQRPKAGLTDPDEVPEPPDEPYVKPGDLYVLGDHRLLCGDATSPRTWRGSWTGRRRRSSRPTRPTASQLDQTWRDGVYNGPRKRVRAGAS